MLQNIMTITERSKIVFEIKYLRRECVLNFSRVV